MVDARAEILNTNVIELAALYRGFWDAHVHGESLSQTDAALPLGDHHGALASWLMAPLRADRPSAIFSSDVRVTSLALATNAGFADHTPFKVVVHGWVVGRVIGRVDINGPVIPAPEAGEHHLPAAYAGLIEHVGQEWMLSQLYEMAGSAVVWRFGGLAEALSPQPAGRKDNIGASLSRLVSDLGDELPLRLRNSLAADRQEAIITCRHALTHVAERYDVGFADAVEQSTDAQFVAPIIEAASYFVCAAIGRELQADDDENRWLNHLERVRADLAWALEFR